MPPLLVLGTRNRKNFVEHFRAAENLPVHWCGQSVLMGLGTPE